MPLKILTANRLIDGRPVWYCADGGWSEEFSDAAVADTPHACTLFELAARQAIASNKVVDATLINVESHNGSFVALRLRERIRANGPTTHRCAENQNIYGEYRVSL
ncbi:MAG: hypothetical protein JSC188_000312 [Candidatus Tokpelaia sp. JSC188]|nr:MAG: hypothetical protein JSC188_000312 [Candidatus Tokpelaia sp. JSC188]